MRVEGNSSMQAHRLRRALGVRGQGVFFNARVQAGMSARRLGRCTRCKQAAQGVAGSGAFFVFIRVLA